MRCRCGDEFDSGFDKLMKQYKDKYPGKSDTVLRGLVYPQTKKVCPTCQTNYQSMNPQVLSIRLTDDDDGPVDPPVRRGGLAVYGPSEGDDLATDLNAITEREE